MDNQKRTIGLHEMVTIFGKSGKKTIKARIDTGATKSSIDTSLARELDLGPVIRIAKVKSASGKQHRDIVLVNAELAGKKMQAEFTVTDRSHMTYSILIGQNILKQGFIIDPAR